MKSFSSLYLLFMLAEMIISPGRVGGMNLPNFPSARDSAVPATGWQKFNVSGQLITPFQIPAFLEGNSREHELASELSEIEADYDISQDSRKAIIRLLGTMKRKSMGSDKRILKRIFRDLAKSSARLRLYPQAMQFFLQEKSMDYAGESEILTGRKIILTRQVLMPAIDTLEKTGEISPESDPVRASDFISPFTEPAEAIAYAIIIQVKQPLPGKRKAFTGLDNVGHLFITLIQYRDNGTAVSRSLGFYPDKNNFFAATPVHPGSPSTFKNDSSHAWDIMVGKYVSKRRFERILRLIRKYEGKFYDLNDNNCTDFGLSVADICGISIRATAGRWPLGRGNNPANAGQSLLEEKVFNTDASGMADLFLCRSKRLEQADFR